MAFLYQPTLLHASTQAIQSFPPKSSFISLFEYDIQNLTLTTHLKSGAVYQHKFFLPVEWDNLKTAQNHSKHWANNICGKHASVRVITRRSPRSELKHKERRK
ncbi:MAG: KTSC domain-containing protein [Patescibacteria group bacterium]|nr:KTSC domain-containing protein [Patescibacteria group bacterium]